jgi:peptidoglycan hydrolase-like protein with peptidoglycan-binding domain
MSLLSKQKPYINLLATSFIFICVSGISVYKTFAETVSGNGYILDQVISPISGALSGNGYTLNQAGQVLSGTISGNGYQSQGVFGTSSSPTVQAPIVNPPSSGSITSSGSGWGYYVLPVATTTNVSTTSPKVGPDTILTANGSTCSSRIALSSPIDVGLKNDPVDVKKLQVFLNTYEGEHLKVTGIYGKADYLAVKKWQAKYRANILAPMRLKNPTGTVYTSSMRQIERQTTAECGQQIIVYACPFFKVYASYGDKGQEVKKIQQFLNIVQGEKLPINGKYGPSTLAAVKRFQRVHKKDIISFVTLSFITGNWNISTRIKANEVIGCDKLQ